MRTTLKTASLRVACRHLDAHWHREAKPQYLKALDFVAGLIRKFNTEGKQVSAEASNRDLMQRVLRMRQMIQDGFDLGLLADNNSLFSAGGDKAVARIEKAEAQQRKLLPEEKVLRAFMKAYPDKEGGARRKQGAFLRALIIGDLGLGREQAAQLDDLVMTDRRLYDRAFGVVNKYVLAQKQKVSSALSTSPGKFQIRDKENSSTWEKSTRRKKVPFYMLGDLLGCRSITTTIPAMAEACALAQAKVEVVAKENKYLDTEGGYNAVHYALMQGNLVVEYQVKAKVNNMEAAISHELIYSDSKFRDKFKMEPLGAAEKAMVARVIDISTQLSLRDFENYFNLGLAVEGGETGDLLYGQNLSPADLEKRLRLAALRLARFHSFRRTRR
jgi:ppGpp synthetase/RelA/SpoT-type nucleotidyltranferase